MKIKYILQIVVLISTQSVCVNAQNSKGDWSRIPGFVPENPLTSGDERVTLGIIGLALFSYSMSEFVFGGDDNLNYYQIRVGANNEYFWGFRKVYLQNFGVEKRVSSWFAIALEGNVQEWTDDTPVVENRDSFGVGAGLMSYYRWYIFGKKRLSPYIEYGAGLFYGFERFPYNGSKFTFNHSTQLGVEYTFKSKDKLRIGYGQFHQSNHGTYWHNPGYDGDGFSVSYSWFWRTSKW